LPFEGTAARLVAAHLHDAPDLTMVPEEQRPALQRALAKGPEDRWPSCAELVQALTRPKPGDGPARSTGTSGRRWRRLVVGLAALAALVAVLAWALRRPPPLLPFDFVDGVAELYRPRPGDNNVRCVDVAELGPPFGRTVALVAGTGGPTLLDPTTGAV